MKKTIIYVISGLGMGGAENQVIAIADKLATKGYSIHVAYILAPKIISPKNQSVKVHFLNGNKKFTGILRAYLNLLKLIDLEKPDVVHSHMFHANILSRLSRIFTHIPRLISTAHSNNEGGKHRMLLYRLTDHLCDIFTNVSNQAAESLESKGAARPGRILTISNGINSEYFQFQPEAKNKLRVQNSHKILFLAIGRLTPAKDYPNLLNAFAILCRKRADIELWIVGSGPLQKEIESLIIQLGIKKNVVLLGMQQDIPSLISAADYFVLPSAWEGFGLVIAEAMACGTFVIATDCGGVKEVMGGNGILVPPKRSDLLANAMIEAINLPQDSIEKNNIEASKYVHDNFDLDTISNKWLKIYTSSLPLN